MQSLIVLLEECLVEISRFERTLTELDHVRLLNLLRRDARGDSAHPQQRIVADVLDAATLVPSRAVPPNVVTMYSQVQLKDRRSGHLRTLTLCYPEDAEPAAGFVSVFSPVGSALLGLQVGDVARWRAPSGEDDSAEVLGILFQPESSGDYAM